MALLSDNWRHGRALRIHCVLGFGIALSFALPALSDITLTVNRGVGPNDIVLTWSGGGPTYTVYTSGSPDLSAGVTAIVQGSPATSATVIAADDIVFFRVGDQNAPSAFVTIPAPGAFVNSGVISASGTVSGSASKVYVNKRTATVNSGTFSTSNVLLAIGTNSLFTTAVASDGNIRVNRTLVTRVPGNVPPIVQIVNPADATSPADTTPFVQVSLFENDPGGMDLTSFHAYLDGTDRTASFSVVGTSASATATWQIAGIEPLQPGNHTLQVLISDMSGYTQSAASVFRVTGPILASLAPAKGLSSATVTINGDGFGDMSNTVVLFNALTATVLSVSPTQVQVRVPSGATDGPVTVQVDGITSNSLPFDVAITSRTPGTGYVAIDSTDRIYFYDDALGVIRRVNQNGTGLATFYDPPDTLGDFAFDPAGTTLYVTTRGMPTYQGTDDLYFTGRIYSVNMSGVATLRFTIDPLVTPRYSDPSGIDVRPPLVYVGARKPDVGNIVLRLDLGSPSSRIESVHFPNSDSPIGEVAVDEQNNIYSIFQPQGVFEYVIYKNSSEIYDIGDAGSMAIDCRNELFFTDAESLEVKHLTGDHAADVIATIDEFFPYGLDIDSKGNLFVGGEGKLQRVQGPDAVITACSSDFPVALTGDAARLLADFDPSVGLESSNVQFVVLTACLGDDTIPRDAADRVLWSWTDIDDPAIDLTIDSNGNSGNDNHGSFDGSAAFTQEGSYSLNGSFGSTYDAQGCSKVRFHFSDAPGDNFVVSADLQAKLGTQTAKSQVMTAWKRLHIELDSMGDVSGRLDDDDAAIGDVPEADPSLLAAVFNPIYVDVVHPTLYDTPNVPFDLHVVNLSTDPDFMNQMAFQGTLGRGSTSSLGNWWTYTQNSYEGPLDADADPSSEPGVLGSTWDLGGKWNFNFSETIRDFAVNFNIDEAYMRQEVFVHELGHEFGLAHELGTRNIMDVPTVVNNVLVLPQPRFSPLAIARIRCGEGGIGCPPPCQLP